MIELSAEDIRLIENIVEAIKIGTAEYETKRKAKFEGYNAGHDCILVADHGSGPVNSA